MEQKLRKYIEKRNFEKTPEPNEDSSSVIDPYNLSSDTKTINQSLTKKEIVGLKTGIFVIQKHDAHRLHYDLRLEIDGVLKSFAIPKEPSMDPSKKRLALETEDHPIEYANFEGIIPKGNYGAGSVNIWDKGIYLYNKDYPLKEAYEKGLIEVELFGKKLHGKFALIHVKFRGEEKGKNWIFKKMIEGNEIKQKPIKIEISNPDKVFFPKSNITKEETVKYYLKVAKYMLPFVKDRFLTVQRFPNGIDSDGFYQKNIPEYYPKDIKSQIYKNTNYIKISKEEDIVYLANQAAIVFHTWQSKSDKPDLPDRIIFDLDPPLDKVEDAVKAAFALKKIIKTLGLKPFLMTTGSRGLHVIVPIKRKESFSEVRDFAKKVSQLIVTLSPKKYTLENSIEKRQGKVYIDILRNSHSQLSVAPYSLRALEGAPIAAPMPWRELKKNFNSKMYNSKNIMRIRDVWLDFYDFSKPLKSANKKIDNLLKETFD